VELIAPGVGDSWFGSDFIPDGWVYSERWIYLWTELIPVLAFIGVGVLFWWLGRNTRAEVVTRQTAEAVDALE
jgi:glutamate:GABA antiporter